MSAADLITQITDRVTVTLGDLARAIGVSARTLSNWRSSKRLPHPENLRALADWLRTHADVQERAADDLYELAAVLEIPEDRRRLALELERRSDIPEQGKKRSGPPQLWTRRGCLFKFPWKTQ